MLYTTNAITQNKTNPSIPKFVLPIHYTVYNTFCVESNSP